ncbi:MAG: LysM peptidoglycan-binding domain-containing protein [Flexistipes sinusarabici]|uniref:LysM peptidoglycan-binding domain-containing protein n=1 Tax=Flexistipes sinusarabici TaxID=2352 RepID=A0A5D0MWD2_FLESI|nr:LysM peptidoglycan-binding domain-containing protein [Flexistipes sinusarabici]TYB36443.1 MAG: LysM peptidoglycan-binding domain-containing protein [Flexistipes sinusarabici]
MFRIIILLCIFFIFTAASAQQKYTIEKGDTLWDIAGEYYDNNFQWPIIWKYNTYINDPDLIFPEDKLVIPILFGGKSYHLADNSSLIKLTSDSYGLENVSKNEQAYKSSLSYYSVDFQNIDNLELILAERPSFELLVNERERTYVAADNIIRTNAGRGDVSTGDKLTIYSVEKETPYGIIYKTAGVGTVTEVEEKTSVVKITEAFEPIEKTFLADTYRDFSFPEPSGYKVVNSDISGSILFMTNDMRISGEGYRCIINLGYNDNVKEGDVLNVVQQVEEDEYIRNVKIATIQIIHSGKNTSTAQIIDSKKEISQGNKVILHKVAIR